MADLIRQVQQGEESYVLPWDIAPLHELHRQLTAAGDELSSRKVAELIDKWQTGGLAVAFSGHFSAGKSSLVNALCGKPLLPSGPIPTSANLVRIAYGPEETVTVHGQRGVEQITVEALAEACRDGAMFTRIDIETTSPVLQGGLSLLDTPGVDSTDDAHRLATEASLHLADAVFFVSDYNHVLSETNLFFLRKLEELQKPYVILVNQVDKHRVGEMSFDAYRNSVEQAFRDWQLNPEGVLYVSVKEPDHPLSEWDRLLQLLTQLKAHAETVARSGMIRSALGVIRGHAEDRYPAEEGETFDELKQRVQETAARLADVKKRQEDIRQEPDGHAQQFATELGRLIDNAPLMTAEVRALAGAYLASRKPGFKVGLLFSAAKTREEQAARLAVFHQALAEQLASGLVPHLQQLLDGDDTIRVELDERQLVDAVQEGAVFTDAYTMTYCRTLEHAIKNRYRRLALAVYEETKLAVSRQAAEDKLAELAPEAQAAEADHQRAEARLEAWRDKEKLIALLSEPFREMAQIRPFPPDLIGEPGTVTDVMDGAKVEERVVGQRAAEVASTSTSTAIAKDFGPHRAAIQADFRTSNPADQTGDAFRYRTILEQAAGRLEEAAALLQDAPVLADERSGLLARADKLRRHRFTAALFGAFSAGKSSFANALFGAPVLPVSPNPTTAAINAVLPPEPDHPHGTATIRMKTAEELLDDLHYSLTMLGLSPEGVDSPEAAVAVMDKGLKGTVPLRGRAHASFLRAASEGYASAKDKLGSAWQADLDEYRAYVAEEHKSCFVKSIDLYLDSALAEQGVVLVDTPGADSIHARHTGVTFNYIRQADAILFVTYYNHAFSRADRQFLEQLGRVKDAFELDRMFFLVNAADLADSEEELAQVLAYVEKELVRHGIRQPRLFALSSREGLAAKQAGDRTALERAGFTAFEAEFARFASGELAETFLQAAQTELQRIEQRLGQLAAQSRTDADLRRERAEAIQTTAPRLLQQWQDEAAGRGRERVQREAAELAHHVKQRIRFRFGDLFADAFHPSVLQQDGRDMGIALISAWRELVQAVTTDVTGEMLATGLRLEQFAVKDVHAWLADVTAHLQNTWPEWSARAWEADMSEQTDLADGLEPEDVSARELSRRFRNAKAFFEGNGRQAMRDWLEDILLTAASAYVDQCTETLIADLVDRYERLLAEARDFVQGELLRFARIYGGEGSADLNLQGMADKIGTLAAQFDTTREVATSS